MSEPALQIVDQTNLLNVGKRNKQEKNSRRMRVSPITIPA